MFFSMLSFSFSRLLVSIGSLHAFFSGPREKAQRSLRGGARRAGGERRYVEGKQEKDREREKLRVRNQGRAREQKKSERGGNHSLRDSFFFLFFGRCGALGERVASRLFFNSPTATRPLLLVTYPDFLSPLGDERRGDAVFSAAEKGASLIHDGSGITRNDDAVAAGVDRRFFFFFACCCTPPADSEEAPRLSPPPQRHRQIRGHLSGCEFARGTPLPVS